MKRSLVSIIHTDIITSSTRGLIPQMIGFPWKSRYYHTHFFVDTVSNFTYIYYTKSTNMLEAIEAKQACKWEIYKYRKELKHIHTYNGTYAYKRYKDITQESKQTITFYSVGAYF